MNIVSIVIMGVLGVLLAVQFKSGKPEYGIYVGIAVSLVISDIRLSGILERTVAGVYSNDFRKCGISENHYESDRDSLSE